MVPSPALLVGDATGLDFLNTVAHPAADAPIDWIADGAGLLAWLEQTRLVPAAALAKLRTETRSGPLDKVADEARDLREWFRAFVKDHMGRPLSARDLAALAPLNLILARDERFSRLTGDADGLSLATERRWTSADTLLLPIAEALARLVSEEDFTFIKACEGPACTLLFVDHTRGRARRWCSMAQCGNRAKQAAHRHRVKAQRDHDN
jgi:predicted RNA-binding Zn ribbon-like protein